jgi:proline dehydrogenase
MEARPPLSFDDTANAFSYKSNSELKKANFVFTVVNHPWVSAVSTGLVKLAFRLRLPIQGIIKVTVFEHWASLA